MLEFYKESACSTAIRRQIGTLAGDGNGVDIVCTATPTHVRKFDTTNYWGNLLTISSDYNYSTATSTISMMIAPTAGSTIVAFSDGEYIFEDLHAVGNDALTANRTLEQQIFIKSVGANAVGISVEIADVLSGSYIAAADHYLAPDGTGTASGTPGSYGTAGGTLAFGDLSDAAVKSLWIKAIVRYGTPMDNYHNIYIKSTAENFSIHL